MTSPSFVIGRQGISESVNIGSAAGGGNRHTTATGSRQGGGFSNVASLRAAQRAATSHKGVAPLRLQPSAAQRHIDQQQRRPTGPPSVTFSELDMFANKNKLKDDEDITDDAPEYEYYEEEEAEEGEDEDRDEINEDDYYANINQAAHKAANVQDDQQYTFGTNMFGEEDENTDAAARVDPNVQLKTAAQQAEDTKKQRRERIRLIAKLRRRNARLPADQRETVDEYAPMDVLRTQCEGASYESKAKSAVLMMRRVTMFLSKIIEAISKRYPKYLSDLEGWSENVYLSLDQYDDMLYDIYDEYGDKMQGNPIVVYLFALMSNAVMYAFARKIINNPVAGAMMNNLAAAFKTNNTDNGVKSTDNSSPTATPTSTGAPDMMKSLASLFSGGGDGGGDDGILGGIDFGELLNGMADLTTKGDRNIRTGHAQPDYRGVPIPETIPEEDGPVQEIKVNPMTGVNNDEVMSLLRRQQDELHTHDNGVTSHTGMHSEEEHSKPKDPRHEASSSSHRIVPDLTPLTKTTKTTKTNGRLTFSTAANR